LDINAGPLWSHKIGSKSYMHVSINEFISYIVIKLQDIISVEKYLNSDIFIL
jgi:hypothetical protein